MHDRSLIYAAAFGRAAATGLVAVLLGIYLARLRLTPSESGAVVGAGLAGGALACLAVMLVADRHGRRRTLMELALLGLAGTIVVVWAKDWRVLAGGAFLGMLNGMGRDRGAALFLEQAMLPSVTSDADRTRAFAIYNVCQDAGHALGALAAGLPTLVERLKFADEVDSLRWAIGLAGVVSTASAAAYLRLSLVVEPAPHAARGRWSPEGRRIVTRISALFLLDSLGGGFLTAALLSFFFFERFGAGAGVVGLLFFAARLANALSHLVAAWLARRIGLVNTMVLTHIPSSLLLVTVAFAPNFPVAALLFLLREGLVEMDVPTRQSYLMAVVRPEDRTLASGVTGLVRLAGWAAGPFLAGRLMQDWSLATPLFLGACLKIAYDVALWLAFRNLKPPEEAANKFAG